MNELLEMQMKKMVSGYYSGLVSGGELDTAMQFSAAFFQEPSEKNRGPIMDALE